MLSDSIVDKPTTSGCSVEILQLAPFHLSLSVGANPTFQFKMMGMYFHFGVTETAILFAEWRTTDWQGIFGSMMGIILLASIYEGLKNYRENLFFQTTLMNRHGLKGQTRRKALFSPIHLLQTLLHMIQLILGYFLMFIFMTYNIWLALAVVIGTGLGYWIFSWDKCTNEHTECCG